MGDTEETNITSKPKSNTGETTANQDNTNQQQQITEGLEYFDSIVSQANFAEYIVEYKSTEYWERDTYESIKDSIEYIRINRDNNSHQGRLLSFLNAFKENIIERQDFIKRKTEQNIQLIQDVQAEKERAQGNKYKISRKEEYKAAKKEDKKDLITITEYL